MGVVVRGGIAAMVVVASASIAHAATPFTDTWDAPGTSDWFSDGSFLNWYEMGGNPGGHIGSVDDGSSSGRAGIQLFEPRATGDYGAAGLGCLSVDVRLRSGEFQIPADGIGDPGFLGFRIRGADDNANGWYYTLDYLAVSSDGWTTLSADFDPEWTDLEAIAAGWEPENGLAPLWSEVLADVEELGVRATGGPFDEFAVDYDNFALKVPNAGTSVLLACAAMTGIARRRRQLA